MSKILRSPLVASVLVSALVFLSIIGLRHFGGLESLELGAYDWFIRLRPFDPTPDSRVVLVTITERDIQNQGNWPLPDGVLAQAIETIARYRPRAIGIDMYRDVPVPPGSEKLAAALTRNGHIIGVMKFGEGLSDGVPPPAALKNTDRIGFNDILVDPGGIVRRALLFLDDGKTTAYSFALRLALLYLQAEGITPQPDPRDPGQLRLGQTTIRPFEPNDGAYVEADARGYQFLLDFKGGRGLYSSVSLTDLLSGTVEIEALRDKVVLIGVTAESVKDHFYSPYSRGLQEDQHTAGVAIHAHIVSQLLRIGMEGASPMGTLSEWQEAICILLWSTMGALIGLRVRSPWRFALPAGGGFLGLGLFDFIAFLQGWWLPLVPPAMGWLFSSLGVTAYRSHHETAQRAALMQLFSRHVSKEVAETVWQQRDQFLDGHRPRSQKLIVTVLFSDLKGFTPASEKMEPEALMDWLNTYMETMAKLVMDHGGVIDDYFGDAIKADFGVPLPRGSDVEIRRDAVNAVNCALAMEREMKQLNKLWQEQGLPIVGMRIGIFTGPVVAGSLGTAQRLKYTTVGDTVNIASRLESFGKEVVDPDFANSHCRILIGETTARYLENQFETKKVGEATLEGKDEKITIYRVVGRVDRRDRDPNRC